MPQMDLHSHELEKTTIELSKAKAETMAWIDLGLPEYGDYLTIYLHPNEGTLRFLTNLESAIQEALAYLVSSYELSEEEIEDA